MLDWSQCPAVERSPDRVSGAWVFRGTRVTVAALFENLESGAQVEEFLEWFPGVSREQVEAVLEHTARSAQKPDAAKDDTGTVEIIRRLHNRGALMDAAAQEKRLSEGAGVVLQARATPVEEGETRKRFEASVKEPPLAKHVSDAVNYRLAVTDLFVEKAQYHLEGRAKGYKRIGFIMYGAAVAIFIVGAIIAVSRMLGYEDTRPLAAVAPVKPAAAPSAQATIATPVQQPAVDNTQRWIDLLLRFILAFTGYGFIVLTAVALARGARACLDQRERLLAKRHSLRQGRLYLHLTGGHVTIEEMERAFNWNHEQHNAFTHMPTDTKAPWGAVIEEVVKITPELVKAGVALAKESAEKEKKNRKEEGKATE